MTGSLNQNYNMTKPRSINLKNISLGLFLLYSLLFSVKNIATNHNRNGESIYIITDSRRNEEDINRLFVTTRNRIILRTDTDTLQAIIYNLYIYNSFGTMRNIIRLLLIVDSTCISLYNYFTEHNKRKSKLYLHKFLLYTGIKINITKNFYLDLYFSLLKSSLPLFLFFKFGDVGYLLRSIQLCINIRIYKNFYLSFNPMPFINIGLLHISSFFFHCKITEDLLDLFPGELPENFNLSDIRCHFDDDNNNIIQNA